jgi:hypothetical protein
MKFSKKSFLIIMFCFLFLNFNLAYANQSGSGNNEDQQSGSGSGSASSVSLNNPLGSGVTEPETIIANVINSIFGIVGSLALLMFIYGGLMWMTSGGNQDKVKQGRGVILWASIGLMVIFLSYMLVRFVIVTIAT